MAVNYVGFGDLGTFELNSTGWNLGATGVRSSAKAHSGSYSIKMTGLNDQCYCQSAYPWSGIFTSGRFAIYSAWVWCDTPNAARLRMSFKIQAAGQLSYSEFHCGDSQWHKLTVVCDAQPDEANPWLAVRTELACNCYFDDVRLECSSGIGEKDLKTSWDELTALDSTKAVGHTQNLIPEQGSTVPTRYKI